MQVLSTNGQVRSTEEVSDTRYSSSQRATDSQGNTVLGGWETWKARKATSFHALEFEIPLIPASEGI